jgi:hypothetical protein
MVQRIIELHSLGGRIGPTDSHATQHGRLSSEPIAIHDSEACVSRCLNPLRLAGASQAQKANQNTPE